MAREMVKECKNFEAFSLICRAVDGKKQGRRIFYENRLIYSKGGKK
jgi:hypothetical protein